MNKELESREPGVCRHGKPHGADCGSCDLYPDATPRTCNQPNGGPFAAGPLAWLKWQLKSYQPESGDVVPRSRYNAANKDWLDEKAAHEKTRQAAADEIDRLQSALTAAQREIAAITAMAQAQRDCKPPYTSWSPAGMHQMLVQLHDLILKEPS